MGALPKPLSQKTIDKMLESWKPETVRTLHAVYASLSNLYGMIMLSDAWPLVSRQSLKLTKKEFMDFSDIARREDLPYYVLEIDEVFTEETRKVARRLIVNKALVVKGYYRFGMLYRLNDEATTKPLYVPDDLLAYENNDGVELNPDWVKLCGVVRNLKTKERSKLSEIVVKEEYGSEAPLADLILADLKKAIMLGDNPIAFLFEALNDADAVISERRVEELSNLTINSLNKSNIWANSGYSPVELSRQSGPLDIKAMTMGPGLKQAIRNGDFNVDELEKMLAEKGIKLIKD